MSKRLITYNLLVLFILSFFFFSSREYYQFKSKYVGNLRNEILKQRENTYTEKLAKIKISVYNVDSKKISLVRDDIITEIGESNFSEIAIQSRANFVDSLLSDSKLQKYLNNSRLNRSNSSLIKRMKLYLPNELYIRFLPKTESVSYIFAIKEYLENKGYQYINRGNIPSVKSKIKHYYYDKDILSDVILNYSDIAKEQQSIDIDKKYVHLYEYIFYIVMLFLITFLLQFLHYSQLIMNKERDLFLLKGIISFKKYRNKIKIGTSLLLFLGMLATISFAYMKYYSMYDIVHEWTFIIFMFVLIFINLIINLFRKVKIVE